MKIVRLLFLLILLAGCGPRAHSTKWNAILISLETTRADHLHCYGYPRATSPHVDQLAQRGAQFDGMMTVSPRTNPSLASLFTSHYPHEHGVRNLILPLAASNQTLTEILKGAGFQTYAVQTHPRLNPGSGFAQGFDTYDDDIPKHYRADQACLAAENWIRKASQNNKPWFLWIHIMDPHWIYSPPAPWNTAFGKVDPRTVQLYQDLSHSRINFGQVIFQNTMPRDEVDSFVNLYDGEIRFTDEALGPLFSLLSQPEYQDRTVIAFTADHGESLGEHNYFFEHGDFGTEPEIHIPLILVAPGKIKAGMRIPQLVRNIDIAPTILELLGVPNPGKMRGSSLLPLLASGGESRSCFGETGENYFPENTRREVKGIRGKWRWLRENQYKLVYVPHNNSEEWKLYDLQKDPGETTDVAAQHPDVTQRMRKLLAAWIAEDKLNLHEEESGLSEEAREQLRSLGYTD